MEVYMNGILEAIFKRRAVRVFEPVEISERIREQILNAARHAPSSFNMQPYRLYWIETAKERTAVAELCLGQRPAKTASALIVVRRRHRIVGRDLAKPIGVDARQE
jgi:nitroreductase